MSPSCRASLDRAAWAHKIDRSTLAEFATVIVHRFEETIGGRAYLIEVMPAGPRWRAQLHRRPGVPTAMMPFYGATPPEAAQRLTDWLTMAHARMAGTPARPSTV